MSPSSSGRRKGGRQANDNDRKGGDHFSQQARREGYPARSVYKLQAIDERHKLLAPNQRLLDLGCSPGSWLKYAAKKVGPGGRIVGIDLSPTPSPAPWAEVHQGDIYDWDFGGDPDRGRFHGVLSDMAPATTGVRITDHSRSMALAERALEVAEILLAPGGFFLVKVFDGATLHDFERETRRRFKVVKRERPPAVRSESKELYILARGFTGAVEPAPEEPWTEAGFGRPEPEPAPDAE